MSWQKWMSDIAPGDGGKCDNAGSWGDWRCGGRFPWAGSMAEEASRGAEGGGVLIVVEENHRM